MLKGHIVRGRLGAPALAIPVLVAASLRLSSSVKSAIQFLFYCRFDLLHRKNVRSLLLLIYDFPNIERIFSEKSFSLGNLFLLINFQKLFTVSNSVSIAPYIFNEILYACSFFCSN